MTNTCEQACIHVHTHTGNRGEPWEQMWDEWSGRSGGIQVWGSGEQEDGSVTDLQAQRCNLLCECRSQPHWLRSRGPRPLSAQITSISSLLLQSRGDALAMV